MNEQVEHAREMAFLALKAQRCFILALQSMGPNPMQIRVLLDIFAMNEKLAEILAIPLPSMEELGRESMEIADLERLLRKS